MRNILVLLVVELHFVIFKLVNFEVDEFLQRFNQTVGFKQLVLSDVWTVVGFVERL